MEIYFIMLSWSVVSSIIYFTSIYEESKKILYILFNYVPLSVICGLRGMNVGTDTAMYAAMVNEAFLSNSIIDYWMYDGYDKRFESAWIILIRAVNFIDENNVQLFFLVVSIISIIGFGIYVYKYSVNIYLSTFLFISLGYWFQNFNLMRQFLGMMILVFAFEMLIKEKRKLYISLVILGSLFHSIILVYLPFIVLSYCNLSANKVRMSLVFIIVFAGFLYGYGVEIFYTYVPSRFAFYFNTVFGEPKAMGIGVYKLIIISSLILYMMSRVHKMEGCDQRRIIFYSMPIMLANFFTLLQYKVSIFYRMIDIFQFFLIMYIPMIVKYSWGNNRISFNKILLIMMIVFFGYGYMYYLLSGISDVEYYIGNI